MTLEQSPLLGRIREIQDSGDTGLLALSHNGQVVTVYFHQGLISAVSTSNKKHRLGQYLAKYCGLENGEVDALAEEARKCRALLGETAVAKSLLNRSELQEIVQEQATQVLAQALKDNLEAQAFKKEPPAPLYMPAQLDHAHLLLEIARNNLQPFKLDPGMMITLANGKHPPSLPWYPAELSVLGELKQPRTMEELAVATGLDYPRLSKILFVFEALRLISFADRRPAKATALVEHEGLPYESLVPAIRKTGLSDKLEAMREEWSFTGEQFKTLKVRISEMAAAGKAKVVMITSAEPQDGKSLICANLAVAYSKDPGRNVIVLDCDLRNPTQNKYFGISHTPGLLGYLMSERLRPYCYMRRLDNLYLLMAGGVASNPVEMLSLDKMRQLIAHLKAEFNTVIIDSPPLAPISDAQILTSLADGVVLVVRSGKTSYRSIENGLKAIDKAKVMGVVFNDVKPVLFNTQYDYRYYHYGHRGKYPYHYAKPSGTRPPKKTYLE